MRALPSQDRGIDQYPTLGSNAPGGGHLASRTINTGRSVRYWHLNLGTQHIYTSWVRFFIRWLAHAQGGGGLLNQVLAPQPTDVSRTVAQNSASQSGLDPSLLKKMLPMLAMLVAGFMAQQAGNSTPATPAAAGGGLGAGLGGLLGGTVGWPARRTISGAGLASMLDMNGDGNALDDILRMAGKAMRQRQSPPLVRPDRPSCRECPDCGRRC